MAPSELPLLPPETWLEILQFATSVPDSLLRPERSLSSKLAREVRTQGSRRRYHESLTIKTRIVQVCRRWNAWFTKSLFEHIWLLKRQQLETLLEVIDRPPTIHDDEGDETTLGSFVQRLDLEIWDPVWTSDRDSPEPSIPYGDAMRLCRSAPNLRLLSCMVFDMEFEETWVSSPLFNHVFPKLEYLCYSCGPRIMISDIFAFMESHPRLTHLDGPRLPSMGYEELQEDLQRVQGKTYPSLEELVVSLGQGDAWFCRVDAGTFPNLTKLEWTWPLYRGAVTTLQTFLSLHGRNLTSIKLHAPKGRTLLDSGTAWFPVLQKFCPRLEELSVTVISRYPGIAPANSSQSAGSGTLPVLSGIKTVGVASLWDFFRYPKFSNQVLDATMQWMRCFPDVKALKWFSERDVEFLQSEMPEGYQTLLQDCRARRVDVLDNFGRCLN